MMIADAARLNMSGKREVFGILMDVYAKILYGLKE